MKFQENYIFCALKVGLQCLCEKCDVHGVGDFFHGTYPQNSYLDKEKCGSRIKFGAPYIQMWPFTSPANLSTAPTAEVTTNEEVAWLHQYGTHGY